MQTGGDRSAHRKLAVNVAGCESGRAFLDQESTHSFGRSGPDNGDVRSHELFSGTVTALVAKDHDGLYAGIEHHFQNGAQVILERPITAKAKRKAKELVGG